MARIVHWNLCYKFGLHRNEKWYNHDAEPVIENKQAKLLWHVNKQCDHITDTGRPDIVIVNKVEKNCLTGDIAVHTSGYN